MLDKKKLLFIENYNSNFVKLVKINKDFNENVLKTVAVLARIKKNKKKVLIFGNGGSAAIASHVSLDLTNVNGVCCQNCNDSSLITCLSNDFGYDNWVTKSMTFYHKPGDLVILISSSGNSKNMIKAAKILKKNKKNFLITFTGFSKKNTLKKLGNVNFWVNSSNYNKIENLHQYWLLLIVDLMAKFYKK